VAAFGGLKQFKMAAVESNFFSNPPFFVSMATAAKFVQPIPICLAYLIFEFSIF
jgi:hypothetical protein